MAPTLPYFHPHRGQCAADAAIAISSSGYDTNTLIALSSATFSSRPVVIVLDSSATRGGDEARGGQRSAPRHRRPPSPASAVLPVPSPTVVSAASFVNGDGGAEANCLRTAAAPHRCPSPCSVLSVRAPGGVVAPALPSSGDGDEAISRPKRKARYRKWDVGDELKVLTTLAKLCKDNLGVAPQASVLLKKILADGGLRRRGVDATELSDKVCKLKKKFVTGAPKVAASGVRRLRKYRNKVLYKIFMELWSDLLPIDVAAAVRVQVAKAARRRERRL